MDIIRAMEYQKTGNYNQSAKLYDKLYKSTKNHQYNVRAIRSYMLAKDFNNAKSRTIILLKKDSKDINMILLTSEISLLQKNNDDALKYAKMALDIKKSQQTLNMMTKIYLAKQEYKTAYNYSNESYNIRQNDDSLNQLLFVVLKYDKKLAINVIEKYITKYGLNEPLGYKALLVYKENRDIDGTISTYRRLYVHAKKKIYAKAVVDLYLATKQNKKAIKFLESNNIDDKYLFSVYKYLEKNKKAYKLAKKIFDQTGDYNYLAEYAMLKYESSDNKSKKLLDDVFMSLETVNSKINNPTYQNYFGYLLIDHNVDIKNGISWVKKALKKDPKSPYYLDSLAWGYYKQKEYQNAYDAIKIVVDDLGFKDDEVMRHWREIKGKMKK
jgi:predicted Zn-dependent protease